MEKENMVNNDKPNNENNGHHSHSHHSHGSHHSGHHSRHHHSHSGSHSHHRRSDGTKAIVKYADKGSSSGHKYRHDSSSERERRGENIIYKEIRKKKIIQTAKRSVFCILVLSMFIFLLYAIVKSDQQGTENTSLFKKNEEQAEDILELQHDIINLETENDKRKIYIKELEERLSEYEEVVPYDFGEE